MPKDFQEWGKQAEYDLETAEIMFSNGRYFYSVFMCHLAIEKGLKGLYQKRLQTFPEKTHNLIFFLEKMNLSLPESTGKFVIKLNEASVATRYPETLSIIQKNYPREITEEILNKSKETLAWIKKQY